MKPDSLKNVTAFCPTIEGVGAVPIDNDGYLDLSGVQKEKRDEVIEQYEAAFPGVTAVKSGSKKDNKTDKTPA